MDSRSKVLADIQRSQAIGKALPETTEFSAKTDSLRQPCPDAIGGESTLQNFVEMLQKVGGEGHILNGEEAALSVLRGILGEFRTEMVLVPPVADFERMAVPRLVAEVGAIPLNPQRVALNEAGTAAAGMTVASCGIADTGTVALWHDSSAGRLAALLPQTHIVLLRRSEVYPDKITYLREMQRCGVDPGSVPMTWVTGPSLTADIEKVLVRGAHGPRRVIVLIY